MSRRREDPMSWLFLIVLGVLSILAGLFAFFNPFAASVAATLIAGWAFLLIGALQIVAAIQAEGWGARLWAVLFGVVALLLGVNLVAQPLEGVLALTLVAGILFVASGVFKLFTAFGLEGNLRWAVLISAVASLILGGIVLLYFPESAFVTLGVLLAMELIANGIALVAMGGYGRSLAKNGTGA